MKTALLSVTLRRNDMSWFASCPYCHRTRLHLKRRKYLKVGIGLLTSKEEMCFWCIRKLKKATI